MLCFIEKRKIFCYKKRIAGVPTIDKKIIENFEIKIPSIEIQKRIVYVLDNFEKICSDLNIGLPSEIELRQK
ncbi:restriction endonuclease subunit S [Metamycoplasma equirhinis]|uniref:restriction endonuclease subunit S n=1 Tax=Metamycoplasma equirhinis TaxID=92402 RepID=UPI003593FFDF